MLTIHTVKPRAANENKLIHPKNSRKNTKRQKRTKRRCEKYKTNSRRAELKGNHTITLNVNHLQTPNKKQKLSKWIFKKAKLICCWGLGGSNLNIKTCMG